MAPSGMGNGIFAFFVSPNSTKIIHEVHLLPARLSVRLMGAHRCASQLAFERSMDQHQELFYKKNKNINWAPKNLISCNKSN